MPRPRRLSGGLLRREGPGAPCRPGMGAARWSWVNCLSSTVLYCVLAYVFTEHPLYARCRLGVHHAAHRRRPFVPVGGGAGPGQSMQTAPGPTAQRPQNQADTRCCPGAPLVRPQNPAGTLSFFAPFWNLLEQVRSPPSARSEADQTEPKLRSAPDQREPFTG